MSKSAPADPTPADSRRAAASRPRKTVLVIEDEPRVRRLIYHTLKPTYRVIAAGDADSALALMNHERVDLVLLDLHLPPHPETAAEGLGIQDYLHRRWPALPVIVASADDDPAVRRQLREQGLRAMLQKPLDPRELVATVGAALEAGGALAE